MKFIRTFRTIFIILFFIFGQRAEAIVFEYPAINVGSAYNSVLFRNRANQPVSLKFSGYKVSGAERIPIFTAVELESERNANVDIFYKPLVMNAMSSVEYVLDNLVISTVDNSESMTLDLTKLDADDAQHPGFKFTIVSSKSRGISSGDALVLDLSTKDILFADKNQRALVVK